MIQLTINTAVAIYVSFFIFLVFSLWLFYDYNEKIGIYDVKFLRQCPFCTYLFFYYNNKGKDETILCPRCKSHFEYIPKK